MAAAMHLNRTLIFVTRRDTTWMYTQRNECLDGQVRSPNPNQDWVLGPS